jgi:cyclopropane fatty-acyl-phospholipid synthase-like methyltransferase
MEERMDFFSDRKNVLAYIQESEGYTGINLILQLEKYLPEGSRLLELGIGPGKDMDILSEKYKVTGSDRSRVFLDIYRETHPKAKLLQLDAVTLETELLFDAVYSNKVLIHLSKAELIQSLKKQKSLLRAGGLLLHSFWAGTGEDDFDGLKFYYYQEKEIAEIIAADFVIVETGHYKEMEENDSFYILLRKRGGLHFS